MAERNPNDMEKVIAALEEVLQGLRDGKDVAIEPMAHNISDGVFARFPFISRQSLGRVRRAAEEAAERLDPDDPLSVEWGVFVPMGTNWWEGVRQYNLQTKKLVFEPKEDGSE